MNEDTELLVRQIPTCCAADCTRPATWGQEIGPERLRVYWCDEHVTHETVALQVPREQRRE